MFIAVPTSNGGLQENKAEFGVNFMTSQFRIQWSRAFFLIPGFAEETLEEI